MFATSKASQLYTLHVQIQGENIHMQNTCGLVGVKLSLPTLIVMQLLFQAFIALHCSTRHACQQQQDAVNWLTCVSSCMSLSQLGQTHALSTVIAEAERQGLQMPDKRTCACCKWLSQAKRAALTDASSCVWRTSML